MGLVTPAAPFRQLKAGQRRELRKDLYFNEWVIGGKMGQFDPGSDLLPRLQLQTHRWCWVSAGGLTYAGLSLNFCGICLGKII